MTTLLLLLLTAQGACFRADVSTDEEPTDALGPPVDTFARDAGTTDGSGADRPMCMPIGDGAPSALQFSVRTSSIGGRFAPKNVGAIWIEDEAGTFVKTLELWGTVRAKWLTMWLASSAGNVVDAVTGATLTSHKTHDLTWNLHAAGGCEVRDGAYKVRIEMTDRSGSGVSVDLPFMKEMPGVIVTPLDTANFHEMRLTLD